MDTVDMIIRSSTSFYNDLKQDKMVDIVRGNIAIQTFSCFVWSGTKKRCKKYYVYQWAGGLFVLHVLMSYIPRLFNICKGRYRHIYPL